MRYFYIPEEFFKLIAEKGKLYSRVWFYWLSEFVDEIFEPDFLEKQEKLYTSKVGEISEIYHFGVQLLQHNFKIIEEKEKKKKEVVRMTKKERETAEAVIEYLNQKAETTFSNKGSNIELVVGRMKEGFTMSDFKCVIDNKAKDWKGTDWEKYLRPITLFSKSKFENYLNGKVNDKSNSNSNFKKFAESVAKAKQFIGAHPE